MVSNAPIFHLNALHRIMMLQWIRVLALITFTTLVSSSILDVTFEELDALKNENNEVWSWECESAGCVKKQLGCSGEDCSSSVPPLSLAVCKLLCPPGTLWPKPSGQIKLSSKLYPVNPNSIYLKTQFPESKKEGREEVDDLVQKARKLFTDRLEKPSGEVIGKNLMITFALKDPNVYKYTQGADESYELLVSPDPSGINVTIVADNFLGGRHGLETLGQLIVLDKFSGALLIPGEISIDDKPAYTHRGVLLDTSRNFVSVDTIKRTLDAMAMNKMNSFHWHITDSHSFPFASTSFPGLTKYGAYSSDQVYSVKDIKDLVEYAKVRGIRIVPEFDAPAHVGEGWQSVDDKDVTVCFKAEPWTKYCVEPPCGQLNPTSEKMYTILEGIYHDMEEAFDSDIFHMGGDEVNLNCWNSSSVIVENMAKMGLGRSEDDFLKLWSNFQSQALGLLEKASGKSRKVVLWTSTLTEKDVEKYLNNSQYIIQIWTKGNDNVIKRLFEKGYPLIFSNYDALYLDCGFGAWVGTGNNWCSPYIPWQKVYENDPLEMLKSLNAQVDENNKKLILGAEATLWTEQADDSSVDNRLWPRTAAMAERLWTGKGSWKEAEPRYLHQRQRMVERNIRPDTVQPQWCYQNQGKCYL